MARIRSIKPEFFTSPSTAAVDFPVRIFYQALWCAADDFGIGETNFNSLLGLAFPDSDRFSAQDVRRFCADCAQHFGTIFYTVRGRHFYYIPTWDKHQKTERRETRRRFPTADDPDAIPDQRIYSGADSAPDDPRKNGADSRGNFAGTGEQGNRGTGEQGIKECAPARLESVPLPEAPAKPTPKRGTRLPQGWMPQQRTIDAIKTRFPNATADQIRLEHEQFTDWAASCTTKAAIKADWDAAWRTWMRRELAKFPAAGRSTTDRRVTEAQALKAKYLEAENSDGRALA